MMVLADRMWVGVLGLLALPAGAAEALHPSVITAAEAKGPVFARPGVVAKGGTRDAISLMTGDRQFESGMYEAGPGRAEWKDKDYGVDEFMLFVKDGVTLTSADGHVIEVKAGDAVSLPAEWRGVWDTKGYTKYYVIRSRGAPLE